MIYFSIADTTLRRRNSLLTLFHPIDMGITINRVCAIYLCKTLGLLLTEIAVRGVHSLCWSAE